MSLVDPFKIFSTNTASIMHKKAHRKLYGNLLSPNAGIVKTNFNGAVFEDLNAAGIGVMVRNSHVEVLAALAKIIPLPSSIPILKTLVARRVVHFVQELDMHSSVFEGDSEVYISTIKNQHLSHPLCGHHVKDILSSVSSLQNFSFSHTLLQDNALAKRAASISFTILVWMESILLDIFKVYVSDCLAIK